MEGLRRRRWISLSELGRSAVDILHPRSVPPILPFVIRIPVFFDLQRWSLWFCSSALHFLPIIEN